jgi:hypothetical protein
MEDIGNTVRNHGEVGQLKFYLHAGLLAPGLLAGRSREHSDEVGAELGKNRFDGPAKAGPIGHQQHHRSNAPGHANHGDERAPAVVEHGLVCLGEQVAEH